MADTEKILAEGILNSTNMIFTEQLGYIVRLLNGNPDFKRVLFQSDIEYSEKKLMIDEVIKEKVDPQVYDVLLMLASSGKIHLIESIYREFLKKQEESTNAIMGVVQSAFPLDPDTMAALEKKFSHKLNKPVRLTLELDKEIIGGLVVIIDDKIFDSSVRAKLDRMKNILIDE